MGDYRAARLSQIWQRGVGHIFPTGADGEILLTPSVYCTNALRASSTIALAMVLLTRHFHTNAGPLPKQTSGSGGCHPAAYYDGQKPGFWLCSKDLTGCACGPIRGASGDNPHKCRVHTTVCMVQTERLELPTLRTSSACSTS